MFKKVPKSTLNRILEIYVPKYRYLKEAEISFPEANGSFSLGDTFYTSTRLRHMTSIEAQLCLNQLCYTAFGEWLTEKDAKINTEISFNKYLELMKENMFIIKSNINFKRQIETNKEIQGKIKVIRTKKFKGLYLAFLDFEFEKGKSEGNLELALKLN